MRVFPVLFVALAVGLPAAPVTAQQLAQAAPGAARAGVAAAVKGDVKLAAVPGVREVGTDVASGDPIFLGDRVTTGAEGRLQIMLLDETVFTIGPNAALVIDRFVYDPQTSAGKVTASVLKGTFRFVTGKVAKREPSDMEVKLPVGSIGVRGTSVAGSVEGDRATVVLLGPGPETNTNERVGRIIVSGVGPGAGTTVEIVRPGFGTEITGLNVPPTPAVRIDPGRIAAITAPLAGTGPRPAPAAAPQGQGQGQSQGPAQPAPGQPQPAQQGQPGPAPQGPAPQGPAPQGPAAPGAVALAPGGAGGAITFVRAPVNPTGGLTGIRTIGALAPAGQQAATLLAAAPQLPPPVPNGGTTHEQLKTITGGTAVYEKSGIAMVLDHGTGTNNGTFSFRTEVNFGTRDVQTTLNATYTLNSVGGNITNHVFGSSYADKTGPIGGGSGHLVTTNITGGHAARFFDEPRNVNGKIAAVMDVKLEIFNAGGLNTCGGAGNCIRGGQTGIPRTP